MKISVIAPTLNEEAHIAKMLDSIRNQEGDFEIIIVDGGSNDRTVEVTRPYARIITSQMGRAVQMNAGAKYAQGEVLLFLHADSTLPRGAFSAIREAMRNPDVVGGTFSLAFDHDDRLLRLYAFFTRFRSVWFHYGDQGLFIRRYLFEELNGYKEMPIMEDIEFLRRLKRKGKLALIKRPVTTSARRFLSNGIFKQEVLNIFLVILYLVGVKPKTLKKWYEAIG